MSLDKSLEYLEQFKDRQTSFQKQKIDDIQNVHDLYVKSFNDILDHPLPNNSEKSENFTELLSKKLVDELHVFKASFNIGDLGKPMIIDKKSKEIF